MEELFFKIFDSLPRQGPGDKKSTKKAFDKLGGLPKQPAILDVGCGSGAQTLDLARLGDVIITALDSHAPYLDAILAKAKEANIEDRVKCVVGDMSLMNFPEKTFDVIWSEGSAYIIGFEKALKSWKKFLKDKGYLVISDMVCFKKKIPQEVKDFFMKECPETRYFADNNPIIQSAGYELLDYFELPSQSWFSNYYNPAEEKLKALRLDYKSDPEALSLLDSFQSEIDLYRKYNEYYGYGFYIMRKRSLIY